MIHRRKEEWREIEDLVISFQKQFKEDCTEKEKKYAQDCGYELITKFSPLFKKYMQLLKIYLQISRPTG